MWAIRFYCFLVLFVHILCLVGVSSRHFPPNNDSAAPNNRGSVQNHQPLPMTHSSNQIEGIKGSLEKEETYNEIKKIGSKPPSCEHKCYGCIPCEAIQVPTTTSHIGILYTNYEPEGWKCKCGPTLYSP